MNKIPASPLMITTASVAVWGPALPATAWPKTKIKGIQEMGPVRCASRVLQCQGKGYEDAEALHGRSRLCTRHGCLLSRWRRGDGSSGVGC